MTPKRGEVALRDARPDEVDALVELQRRSSLVYDEYRAQLLAHPDAIELPAEHVAGGCVRVATGPDRVLGFATVVPEPGGVGELDGLFVEPDAMGRGIGRLLVEDASAVARARGDRRIDVTANPKALGFYEKLGFVTDREVPTRFGPAIRMHRDLST